MWDKDKRYTYTDCLEWKRMGYRGMELLNGIPYQYGVCAFDEEPVPFPPEKMQAILGEFHAQLERRLAGLPYRVFRSKAVLLGEEEETPDIVVLNDNEELLVVIEIVETEKFRRLEQCTEAEVEYWAIFPDTPCITVYSTKKRWKTYGTGKEIPIEETGCKFSTDGVWCDDWDDRPDGFCVNTLLSANQGIEGSVNGPTE